MTSPLARLGSVLAGLVALGLLVVLAFDPVSSWIVWLQEGDPVISVRLPAVHTRERLLNDRYEQVEWLDDQLQNTKRMRPPEPSAPQPGGPGAPSSAEPAGPAGAPREAAAKPAEAADPPPDPVTLRASLSAHSSTRALPTALNWFETIDSYRDVLRGERAIAMLDDRHDLDGNELYFLTFDTSIIAGPGRHGYGVVSVMLGPTSTGSGTLGATLAALHAQDDRDIYYDWMERLQNELDESIDLGQRDFARLITYADREPPENTLETLACMEWLVNSGHLAPDRSERRARARLACSEALRPAFAPVERLAIEEHWRVLSRDPDEPDYRAAAARFAARLNRLLVSVSETLPGTLERGYQDAANMAVQMQLGRAGAAPGQLPPPPSYNQALQACIANAAAGRSPSYLDETLRIYVPCPVPNTRVSTLLVLSSVVHALLTTSGSGDIDRLEIGFQTGKLPSFDIAGISVPAVSATVTRPDGTQDTAPIDQPEALGCLTAILQYDTLNAEAGRLLPGRGERLDHWFDLRLEQHGDGTCKLQLQPRISPSGKPKLAGEDDLLRDFSVRLESVAQGAPTFAFSYSQSPRLRQPVAIQRTSSIQLGAAGKLGGANGGDTQEFSAESNQLNVVGYEPHFPPSELTRRAARFGWIISPQMRGGASWQRELPTQQAELGAVISVPSWWRTVGLRICSRYTRRLDTESVVPADDHCRDELLRLPGTASEVSRRLGQEVVKFPFLRRTDDPTTLEAGRSGRLLLEGGRLWRSTVVMLGAQRADRIEVLPNMRGIAAYFRCVETPSLLTADPNAEHRPPDPRALLDVTRDRLLTVPVRVWTSEDVTYPTSAYVVVRGRRKPADYCRDEYERRPDDAAAPP